MESTTKVKRMFDLCRQYDVYEPWLKENGFTLQDLPLTAKTEDGEDVIVEALEQDGEVVWKITTVQSNNWLRTNYYYEDGTVEELY